MLSAHPPQTPLADSLQASYWLFYSYKSLGTFSHVADGDGCVATTTCEGWA